MRNRFGRFIIPFQFALTSLIPRSGLVLFISLIAFASCTPKKKKSPSKSESSTTTPATAPAPTGSIQVSEFQGKPTNQWIINPITGSLKTNSNVLNFSGNCPSTIVSHLALFVDGIDSGIRATCLTNTFNITFNSSLSDNWQNPGNNGFGNKLDLISLNSEGQTLPNVPTITYYVIIKSQAPSPIQFTDITFYRNNILETMVISNGAAIEISPDLNSGGLGNSCASTQAEVRLNGTYNPSSADDPLSITPTEPSSHSGNQFQYRICLESGQLLNLQISHADTFGNSPTNPLILALRYLTSSTIDTIIPNNLASSFVTQSLDSTTGGLTSGSLTLVHSYMGISAAEPSLTSSINLGYFLDFDYSHYLTKVNQ